MKNTFGTINNYSYHLTSNNEFIDSRLIHNPSKDTQHDEDTDSIENKVGPTNVNWNINETRDVVHMVNDIQNMFK